MADSLQQQLHLALDQIEACERNIAAGVDVEESGRVAARWGKYVITLADDLLDDHLEQIIDNICSAHELAPGDAKNLLKALEGRTHLTKPHIELLKDILDELEYP